MECTTCPFLLRTYIALCLLTTTRASYTADIPRITRVGTAVFNASLGSDWHYNIQRSLTAKQVQHLTKVDASSGVLRLHKEIEDCYFLHENPFTVYIEARYRTRTEEPFSNQLYTIIPVAVHVRGEHCKLKHRKKKKHEKEKTEGKAPKENEVVLVHDPQQSVLADFLVGSCWEPSQSILRLISFIPGSVRHCNSLFLMKNNSIDIKLTDTSTGAIGFHNMYCFNKPNEKMIMLTLQIDPLCLQELYGLSDNEIPMQVRIRVENPPKLVQTKNKKLTESEETSESRRRVRRGSRTVNRSPSFPAGQYFVNIPEEAAVGYIVETVAASDPDPSSSPSGVLTYTMTAERDARSLNMFNINEDTGLVTTSQQLDREVISEHLLKVTVRDHGTPTKSAIAYLQITVQDINDHAPEFEVSEYAVSIEENQDSGTTVTEVYASDGDEGINSDIRYSILNPDPPNDAFAIHVRSGTITTRTRLDREKISEYILNIKAVDLGTNPGALSSTTQIIITVQDVNDNYPQFSKRNYEVGISEDSSPNRVIETIIATDADEGENAQIRYSMVGGNSQGHFVIDAYNGEIMLTSTLDFESASSYRLVVRAQDGGRPSKSNSTHVIITIIDVNDNVPRFPTNLYPVSVREDVRLWSPIILVQAFDADAGEFARITYTIIQAGENFPFEIEEGTGQITNKVLLDRELQDSYDFNVRASDQGVPPKMATTEVRVSITDVNDNPPIFSQQEYFGKVDEDAFPGTSVLDLVAVDPDIGNSVSYQITNGNVRNRFSIVSQFSRGTISVALPLDYKQEPRFVLTVTASDNHFSSSCLVHINVTDTNTYRPVFDQSPYNAFVTESVSVGHMVVQVHATDGDSGENARITYSIDNLAEFEINADTGEIYTTLLLDRETKPSYTIHVTATDNGMEPQLDTTEVEIFLTDVNDNAPFFSQSHYFAEISEAVNIATSVIQIQAEDLDNGANSQIMYTFSNGHDDNGAFIVDEGSGVIRTAQRLDREQKASYQLVAYAQDGGRPMQQTSVDITVTIIDENDNPPVFAQNEFNVDVEENRARGSPVSTITANDPDEGYNAFVHYTLVDGDTDLFEIDSTSGILITLLEFDYEERYDYYVKVRATSVPFFNDAIVNIHILDQNDNRPVLSDFDIYFNNYEGHFPVGDIGQVPAYDPDVSDVLTYSVRSGNRMDHLMLNKSTGGIGLNAILAGTDIPIIIPFSVEVSDGLNLVTALCTFHMTRVTDDMLHSSVTVQLEDINSEQFLSPKLHKFIDALSTIIPIERKWIYMFSIKEDIVHSGPAILNVTFAAQRPDGQYFSSQYLQERIYLERSQLSRVSEAIVLPFGDNLCLYEICSDYFQCLSPQSFWSTSGFIATTLVIFRSIHPEVLYKCDCPLGFTGNYCKTEINFCYTEPCKNDGECMRKEGGYVCICPTGFTGVNCEISIEDGRCTRDVCKNGGQCRNYLLRGFECHCPGPVSEFDGPFCEVRTRNFPEGSFLMFWSLNQRVRLNIALSFATKERNGLLFYNGRFNQRHDFIALEIVDSQVRFTFSSGEDKTQVGASILGGVSDGKWHKVMVDYHELTATIILDDCNSAISLQHGRTTIGNYTCAARATQRGKYRFLDLNGPFLLGGLPSLPDDFLIDNPDYIGCIRDVYIDHSLLDLANNIEDMGTLPGCSHKKDFCFSDPCFQKAECVSGWDTYTCHCDAGYGGRNCQEELPHILRFEGDGYMDFQQGQIIVSIPWVNRILFRTRYGNGLLMYIKLVSSISINIEIVDGHIQYRTSTITIRFDNVRVDDGVWHDFLAEWKNNNIVISLDHGQYKKSVSADSVIDAQQVSEVLIGGMPSDEEGITQGMKGCLQGMTIGNLELDSTAARRINVKQGCPPSDACAEVSCPQQSVCVDLWDDYSCECHTGHYGDQCTSACDLGVCEHGSFCLPVERSLSVGYQCKCSDLYFGDHCEYTVQVCAEDWWGHHICGPCECDEERGFNSDCNKTTGICYCQDHSYRPMVFVPEYNSLELSDTCYPCDCHEMGSLTQDCDQQTGECDCKRGVIGRRCDSCHNPYAEVTLRGCEVVYDSCPKRYSEGIWWPRTKFGRSATAPCPVGTTGKTNRKCSYEENWLKTNLFNCTSETFSALNAILSDLHRGVKLHPELSFQISYELYKATTETTKFYGNDINIGYMVLSRVLKHEIQQKGLNVTAANKRNFTRYIVESASSLLDPSNIEFWEVIQRSSLGAEELMDNLEGFGASIARTSDFTYPPEFAVITPNIIMHHDIIVRENFTSVAIPDYDPDIFFDQVITDHTRIHIPGDVIQPQPFDPDYLSISSNVAVTSYIRFNSIDKLLPNKTDKSVLTVEDFKGQSINTPVISLSLYDELTEGDDMTTQLNKPITIEMRVLNSNMTNPQCLFWNFTLFSDHSGGWSSVGCKLTGYNRSHVNCSCKHLTSFAVLMDESPEASFDVADYGINALLNKEGTDLELDVKLDKSDMMHSSRRVALQVITYMGLILSILALILAFITMVCLTNLYCNLNSIHRNLVFVLIVAELTFLVGIDSKVDHVCTVVAIVLHYTLLSAFGWMFIEGIHLYRMMTEVRNINRGGMTWYYLVAYGVPGIIVGLAVPLSEANYGQQVNAANQHFCWLSMEDMLIWSFAGPALAVVVMNVIVFFMAMRVSLNASRKNPEFNTLRSGLRAAGILLPLLGITWVFGLLSVNQNSALFQYLFAFFNCLLGCSIFFFHCALNQKVRKEWMRCLYRVLGKKVQFDDTATSQRSALSYSKSAESTPNRFNIGISTHSLGSSRSTTKTSTSNIYRPDGYINKNVSVSTATTTPSAHDYVPSYYKPSKVTNLDDPDLTLIQNTSNLLDWDYDFDRNGSMRTVSFSNISNSQYEDDSRRQSRTSGRSKTSRKSGHESDSDSDVSVRRRNRESMSLASSHSSDEEERPPPDVWKNTPNKVNLPDTVLQSTPKKTLSMTSDGSLKKQRWPEKPYSGASDTESRRSAPIAKMEIYDTKLTPEKEYKYPPGSDKGSTTGSLSGSNRNLVVSNRPDVLPLKGIMKTPKSSIQSYSGSNPGSTSSLTRIGTTALSSSQSKLATSLTLTRDRVVAIATADNHSDGGSSNETPV